MYSIEIVPEALEELSGMPIFYRRIVEKLIETQLTRDPLKPSRHCKMLTPLTTPFAHEPPLWELRAGDWRIFYDVDEEDKRVVIRAIRKKPPGKRTEEIL